jgi:hypothetical protein
MMFWLERAAVALWAWDRGVPIRQIPAFVRYVETPRRARED